MGDAIVLVWLIVGGAIGSSIGTRKNRPLAGLVLGALFGPLGWLLVAVGPTRPDDDEPTQPDDEEQSAG